MIQNFFRKSNLQEHLMVGVLNCLLLDLDIMNFWNIFWNMFCQINLKGNLEILSYCLYILGVLKLWFICTKNFNHNIRTYIIFWSILVNWIKIILHCFFYWNRHQFWMTQIRLKRYITIVILSMKRFWVWKIKRCLLRTKL